MTKPVRDKPVDNPTVGVVGYSQYLRHRIKNAHKVFENSPFVYEEYSKKDKEQKKWFEQNGFKKPFPVATLSIRIGIRKSDLAGGEDEIIAKQIINGTKVKYAKEDRDTKKD